MCAISDKCNPNNSQRSLDSDPYTKIILYKKNASPTIMECSKIAQLSLSIGHDKQLQGFE